MKCYRIDITASHSIFHLMKQPLRNKKQVDRLLLETLRTFIIGNIETENTVGKIILNVDKMNRFIYEVENKIFSINCPFTCLEKEDKYIFKDSTLDIEIDSKLISYLITIINKDKIDSSEELLQDILDINEYEDIQTVWTILKKLYTIEYGYLRYDYDEEKEAGKLHPLNHLDINYMNANQYKVGLDHKITVEEFVDILNTTTESYYLSKR